MKVQLPRFADGPDMGCERTRGIKHEGVFFWWEAMGGAGPGEEGSSALVLLKLGMDVK